MTYRLIGAELSPYSVKVRSYLRYKKLPFTWTDRGPATQDDFRRYAKLPLIPLLISPDDQGMQDSTPIIETLEAQHPAPSIIPEDPVLAFVSALIEEYGDEWGNKPMFHYRWRRDVDAQSGAERIVSGSTPDLAGEARDRAVASIKAYMVPRLSFVGSSDATAELIEASLARLLAILEVHLASRSYLFGGRPALGDFGLFAQLYECSTDPTPGAIMRERAPNTLAWINRMLDPGDEGPFENWDSLKATLTPLLRDEVAAVFLPWTRANAAAVAAGQATFSVQLPDGPFSQETQKYHARSLAALGKKYAEASRSPAVPAALREAGVSMDS